MDSVFEILIRIFGWFFITYLDTLIETLFDKQSTKKEKIAGAIFLFILFGGIIALTVWGTTTLIAKDNKIGAALVGSFGGLLMLVLTIRAIYDIVKIKKNQ